MWVRYALLAACSLGAMVAAFEATPASAEVCSVFDRHPCLPTVCSVFRRRPCIPEVEYWIGQDLRLTIESVATRDLPECAKGSGNDASDRKLHSLCDMFAALRACWVPPPRDEARLGMQMSVRFAFKRSGEIMATPRVTYASPDAPPEARETLHKAITAALARCMPLPFNAGLGGAVAGRPIAIRFVDNRTGKGLTDQP